MAIMIGALEAWPTRTMLDRQTRKPVGAEYEWNDGKKSVRWFDGAYDDVVYVELAHQPLKPSI